MCCHAKKGDVWLMSIMGFDVIRDIIEHIDKCEPKGYLYVIKHVHALRYDMKPTMGVHDIKSIVNVNVHDNALYMNLARTTICIITNTCHTTCGACHGPIM